MELNGHFTQTLVGMVTPLDMPMQIQPCILYQNNVSNTMDICPLYQKQCNLNNGNMSITNGPNYGALQEHVDMALLYCMSFPYPVPFSCMCFLFPI